MTKFRKSMRWLPLLVGAAALVSTGLWSVKVGLPLDGVTAADADDSVLTAVEMTAVPLVCPPSTIDPEALTELEAAADEGSGEVEGALAKTWAPGGSVPLSGGGSYFPIEAPSATGDLTGVAVGGVPQGDLLSLLVDSCAMPSKQLALAAGATTVGEDAVLIVSNPADKSVNVQVEVYDKQGVALPTPAAFTVPAGSTTSVLPGAWAPGLASPALAINSDGLGVAAWLQTSALDGEVPLGVARVQGTAPGERLVLTGLTSSRESVLRVGNLSEERTNVSVTMLLTDGAEPLAGAEAIPVSPHSTVSVDLAGLPSEARALIVDASQPITANVTESTTGADHPKVRDAKFESRTTVAPGRAITGTELIDPAEISAFAQTLGFTSMRVGVAVANPSAEDIELEIQGASKVLAADSSAFYGLLEASSDMTFTTQAPVYASYVFTADTPVGPVRAVTSMGTEGVLAQTRLVSLVPASVPDR